jgi:CRISPR-associated endonuclease/helicase Cas3
VLNLIAHIRKNPNGYAEQTVKEHCSETAALCSGYAASIEAAHIGQLQGLLHDAGKLTAAFERYIKQETDCRRGEIDHAYAGAKYLWEIAEKSGDADTIAVARLIAHTIISHHGIHDWLDGDDEDYFAERLAKTEGYAEVLSHTEELPSAQEITALLGQAVQEYSALTALLKQLAMRNKTAYGFYMGMLERFLQSCLIDADRTNTADFMSDSCTEKHHDLPAVWDAMHDRMQAKCDAFAERTDAISVQRCSISDRCAAFAKHPVKACRLIVPTGGGKTLSSLRFAIEYCREHGKQKIVYTAPFMSILEQNSDEIRDIAGEDGFTEHHSNLLAELETSEELHEYELRTEKWDAPVIATTMVQLLNTLFSGKTSSIRRMHRLADAVIIIDEVQSIPLKCVHLFDLAVNFLTHICGAIVILCSATQPTMEQTEFPLLLDEVSSMTGDTAADFAAFHRTEVISAVTPHGFSYEEAADFCAEKYEENGNLLLIVNTKAAAKKLFSLMQSRCPDTNVLHLSTNLCPAHRREKITEMRTALKAGQPLICVTTQLIEAGVDISFRCVVRSLAGLDNAAQAAGRCNRNGESETPCPVYLIKLKEENVNRLEGVQTAQQITDQMLGNAAYQDYLSVDTQMEYFRELYRQSEKKLDYPVRSETLVELLSLNRDHYKMSGLPKEMQFSVQAFKTAGSLFEVIDSRTQDILVPFNEEAESLIAELNGELSPERCREILRKAQKYTVSVYNLKNLDEIGALYALPSGVIALDGRFYDRDCGIVTEGAEQEVLIF